MFLFSLITSHKLVTKDCVYSGAGLSRVLPFYLLSVRKRLSQSRWWRPKVRRLCFPAAQPQTVAHLGRAPPRGTFLGPRPASPGLGALAAAAWGEGPAPAAGAHCDLERRRPHGAWGGSHASGKHRSARLSTNTSLREPGRRGGRPQSRTPCPLPTRPPNFRPPHRLAGVRSPPGVPESRSLPAKHRAFGSA